MEEKVLDNKERLKIEEKKNVEVKVTENNMTLLFDAKSENEALARVTVASFVTKIDPTIEEINDIKTAVSEAVTNSVIHGYRDYSGQIEMQCILKTKITKREDTYAAKSNLTVIVKDNGVGIENIEMAMEPLYTSKPELDRAGMGFAFMQLFMDQVEVWSKPKIGTIVTMTKELKRIKKR